jgi:hypothetical protein
MPIYRKPRTRGASSRPSTVSQASPRLVPQPLFLALLCAGLAASRDRTAHSGGIAIYQVRNSAACRLPRPLLIVTALADPLVTRRTVSSAHTCSTLKPLLSHAASNTDRRQSDAAARAPASRHNPISLEDDVRNSSAPAVVNCAKSAAQTGPESDSATRLCYLGVTRLRLS